MAFFHILVMVSRAGEMEYSSVDECVAVGFRTHTAIQQFKKMLELFVPIKGLYRLKAHPVML